MNEKVAHVLSEAKKGSNGHTCHAAGCTTNCAPSMFMCRRHWFMVPKDLRDAIWMTYEPGQEQTKDASAEYLETAHEAIAAVAAKEERK